jgi:hypothetical protein
MSQKIFRKFNADKNIPYKWLFSLSFNLLLSFGIELLLTAQSFWRIDAKIESVQKWCRIFIFFGGYYEIERAT